MSDDLGQITLRGFVFSVYVYTRRTAEEVRRAISYIRNMGGIAIDDAPSQCRLTYEAVPEPSLNEDGVGYDDDKSIIMIKMT